MMMMLTLLMGSKKERQGCEVLTLMLQALQSIVTSEALPADRVLLLLEATVTGIPPRVLGSTSYQVGKMDVLNGTPALFVILMLYNSSLLSAYIQDERFFQCLQTLVGCGLSGPTSPLAFAEAVLGALRGSAGSVQNKEQLLRMWSVMVGPLTDTITQSNEVNQGDALEHNFSAMHSALLFPVTHLLPGAPLQQAAQKSMLSTWSKLYKVFARCSALVVTAEENICCEELCAKMSASIDKDALKVPSTLNAVSSLLQVVVECVDFSPYTPQFQQKLKSPHTPVNWMKKKNKTLGNLSTFQSLLVQCLDVYLDDPEASSEATGVALVSVLSALFTNLVLANAIQEVLASLIQPLALFYKQAASEPPKFTSQLLAKLEKLLGDVLGCLQSRSTLAYDNDLLSLLSPLLCVVFPHRNKQLRTSVTQFWNATFANSVGLSYPEEIRPILNQVKQKIPIILPGFEVVTGADELSGQFSSESSQMETKLSGMPVSSVGKRDSLLGKVPEPKDKSSTKSSKPVSTKLDFGSPKPPRREVLEEEASIDFVFIPPETKERVLTEHQKEVKRTKRVDIPAMYNNLDASLDTTAFTQYTQSQEDSLDKLPAAQADKVNGEAPGEVPKENVENEEDLEILSKATQDYASPKEGGDMTENHQKEEVIPESTDVSMEDEAKIDSKAEDKEAQCKEGSSPNASSSSDLVLGTPQKPNSRRQSFITLEKYTEGKSSSPSGASKFTGPLMKTSNSQEPSNSSNTSTPASQTSSGPNSQGSQVLLHPVSSTTDSPRRPKDSGLRSEPVKLTERLPSDTTEDEDVIPGTQIEEERKESSQKSAASVEMNSSSQEEELDDSQSSLSQTSSVEPRRSGRPRVRPLLPGESPEEREDRYTPSKRKRSGEEPKSDSQKSSPVQSRPNTRSKQAAEEDGSRDRLRTRAQREKSETSQSNSQGRAHKKVKLHSGLGEFLDKPEPRRRSTRESSQSDLQSDSQSDYESQSQGRRVRRSKASLETEQKTGPKKEVSPEKEQSSQTASQELEEQTEKDNELKKESQVITSSPQTANRSQETDLEEQTEKKDDKPKMDSQITSSQIDAQSQEVELVEKPEDDKRDSSMVSTEPQDGPDVSLTSESEVRDKQRTKEGTDGNLSQDDSQVSTPSSSDSQSLRRSGRSKAVESEDKGDSKDSSRRQSRSNSQTIGQAEVRTGGRTRRSKVHEELSKSSPSSTPESSQSLDDAGSTEKSQGRGRYSRRRSSQVAGSMESSMSESPETRDNAQVPKRRGRRSKALLPSPLTVESQEDRISNDVVSDIVDGSQKADTQTLEANNATDLDESQESQDLQSSELSQVVGDDEEQSNKESPMEAEVDAVEAVETAASEKTEVDDTKMISSSPSKTEQRDSDDAASQETHDGDLQTPESAGVSHEEIQEELPSEPSAVDTLAPPGETTQIPQESSEDKAEEVSETADSVKESEKESSESNPEEHPVTPVEDTAEDGGRTSSSPNQEDCLNVEDAIPKEDEQIISERHPEDETAPQQEVDKDGNTQTAACQDEEKSDNSVVVNLDSAMTDLCSASSLVRDSNQEDVFQDSPVKQKDLEAVMALDVGQSPSTGRTRGTWSPSASPSTSILKKGQKRPLEEDTPSPLVKSRRVSFADPIQQQETADDIDRRSPAVRTSSPRRPKMSNIPQPKYVTTPTKGLLILSPRNLRSPGYKSSKKCLISEMSQEPRPVPRDCIYPALVGCSTPVEAVLPQISSNMWSRGFGQLVRARNIKTVGDLSALTPSEIKTLPIRSPKISNVKKALKSYEQQRKGRGGDELKSFDEMEMMTSELEETSAPQNQDEEDKTSGETLATELVDEPAAADGSSRQDVSENQTQESAAGEQPPAGGRLLPPAGLLSEVEALTCRMTPTELSGCSSQQLVQLHDQLGGMMQRVVVELHTRLQQTEEKP
ncbi:hypothetical protein INR49_018892 [Caranx melampygus]|nr:hypothetical protein INR49_018892 [Caranx melampygus]